MLKFEAVCFRRCAMWARWRTWNRSKNVFLFNLSVWQRIHNSIKRNDHNQNCVNIDTLVEVLALIMCIFFPWKRKQINHHGGSLYDIKSVNLILFLALSIADCVTILTLLFEFIHSIENILRYVRSRLSWINIMQMLFDKRARIILISHWLCIYSQVFACVCNKKW